MGTENRFQRNLRNQILKTIFVGLLVMVIVFYTFTMTFNIIRSNNELKVSVSKVVDIYQEVERKIIGSNDKLKEITEDTVNEVEVYTELYALKNDLGVSMNLILTSNDKVVFSSFSNDEMVKGIHFSYQNLLRSKIINDEIEFVSYRSHISGNMVNFVVFAQRLNDGYSYYYFTESDLLNIFNQPMLKNFVVVDQKGHVVMSTNQELISTLYKFNIPSKDEIEVNDVRYKIKVESINDTLSVVGMVGQYDSDYSAVIIVMLIVLGFAVAFVMNYFSKKISENSSSSLTKLLERLERIKDLKDTKIGDLNTEDEFEIIAQEIDELLLTVQSLNKRNEELLGLKKDIEIKHLEAQFNPHFLYNTLETIRYVMIDDQKQASELIVNLTRILRYSIADNEDSVTFEEDFTYINNYLMINKVRFQERFDYTIRIDDKCLDLIIPKLILQPIIENSIKHNFVNKDKLSIWISADIVDDKLYLEVEDNGDGIKKDDLDELIKLLNSDDNETSHIGLYNVARRLRLMYPSESEFTIASSVEIGTKVMIKIPLKRESYV